MTMPSRPARRTMLGVAALLSTLAGGAAKAEVHRIECPDPAGIGQPHRIAFDDTAGTITVNGKLFGNGHNRIEIGQEITWDLILNTPTCRSNPSGTEIGGMLCSARFGTLTRDLRVENRGTSNERRCVPAPD